MSALPSFPLDPAAVFEEEEEEETQCRPKLVAAESASSSSSYGGGSASAFASSAPLLPTDPHLLPRLDQQSLVSRALVLIASWVPLKAADIARDAAASEGLVDMHTQKLIRLPAELESLRAIVQRGETLALPQRRRQEEIEADLRNSSEWLRAYRSNAEYREMRMAGAQACLSAGPRQSPVRVLHHLLRGIQFTICLLFPVWTAPTPAELSLSRRWLQRTQCLLSDLTRSLSPEQMRADIDHTRHVVSLCADVGELQLIPALLEGSGLDCSAIQYKDQPYLLALAAPSFHFISLVGQFSLFRLGLDPALFPSSGQLLQRPKRSSRSRAGS